MPLGDAQVHQGESFRAAETGADRSVLPAGEPVALTVHSGGGVLDRADARPEPFRGILQPVGQFLRRAVGRRIFPRRTIGGGADCGDADQFLPLLQQRQAALAVIGPAHPAGGQPHGFRGEDDLLTVVAAFFLQVRVPGGTGEEQVIPYALDAHGPLGEAGKGLRAVADQPEVQPGAAVALADSLAELLALGRGEGAGQKRALRRAGEYSVGQDHKSSFLPEAGLRRENISDTYVTLFFRIFP